MYKIYVYQSNFIFLTHIPFFIISFIVWILFFSKISFNVICYERLLNVFAFLKDIKLFYLLSELGIRKFYYLFSYFCFDIILISCKGDKWILLDCIGCRGNFMHFLILLLDSSYYINKLLFFM